MVVVGGLDIHRKQLTSDYVEVETGRLERGRIAPADREHLAGWLSRFDGVGGVAFAMEGCTGWRYVAEEMRAAGVELHLAEPADTSVLRGPKRRAKRDKADAQLLRELLATGRLPECYIPPSQVLEWRALPGALPRSAAGAHRVGAACPRDLFPPGHTALGGAGVVRGSRERLDHIVAEQLSPVGRLQQHRVVRHGYPGRASGPAAPAPGRHRPTRQRRPRADGRHPRSRPDDLAGRCAPGPQGGPVHRARHHRARHHRALLGQQAQPGPAVEAGTGGAAVAAVRGGQDLRPRLRPRPPLLRRRQTAL
jgi:hypothetical protein